MVSAVDLLPTFLRIAEIKDPEGTGYLGLRGIQGRSFLPIIKGSLNPPVSSVIFKEYNENSGGIRNPMRGVQTPQYLYLFNPWSNGKRAMATATNGTATWKRMLELASENETIRKPCDNETNINHFDYEIVNNESKSPFRDNNLLESLNYYHKCD